MVSDNNVIQGIFDEESRDYVKNVIRDLGLAKATKDLVARNSHQAVGTRALIKNIVKKWRQGRDENTK